MGLGSILLWFDAQSADLSGEALGMRLLPMEHVTVGPLK